MKKKLYFHIGWPKTGTSFLQSILFAAENEEFLQSNSTRPIKGIFSHSSLEELTQIRNCSAQEISAALKSKTDLYPSAKTFVLSQESMASLENADVAKLGTALADYDTKIIIYLRRQDGICESSWKQWYIKLMSFSERLEEYKSDPIRYAAKLETWEKAFGLENMMVRTYEKEVLKKGLEDDFFPLIGLDHSQMHIPAASVNTGFDRDTLDILYHSRENLNGIHDNRLNNVFSKYQGAKKQFQKYQLLSMTERKALLELHREENRAIAKKYQGRDEDLFSMHVPDEEDSKFDGIAAEKAIPFLTKIILDQQEEIQQLNSRKSSTGPMGYKQILKALLRRIKS
jgi:hypothetical protein